MRIDNPEPGLFKLRWRRNAPWQPVRIWIDYPVDPETLEPLDRPPLLCCTVAGKEHDPYAIWSWCAGNPIATREYQYLTNLLAWSDGLGLDRGEAVDLGTVPVLY